MTRMKFFFLESGILANKCETKVLLGQTYFLQKKIRDQ